jgi:simple sugar transport system permease protein
MAITSSIPTTPPTPRDRVLRGLLSNPGAASVIGVVVILLFFALQSAPFRAPSGVSNWLDPASLLGICSIAVAMLMIGGEFDLSVGVMSGSTGLVAGLLGTYAGLNFWASMLVSLAFAVGIGVANGVLVVYTKLPSFIVTLGTFLALQGLNLGVTKLLTAQVFAGGLDEVPGFDSARAVLGSQIPIAGTGFPVSILWWIGLTLVAAWIMARTRFGSWVFAVGGDLKAARSVGVPVARTKVMLFVITAASGWLVGMINATRLTSVQANQGVGNELIFIVAATIGGCLLTGGLGSVLGAAGGALIFGMAQQGIVYMGWDSDWFFLFLGVLLLAATLTNHFVRRVAERQA